MHLILPPTTMVKRVHKASVVEHGLKEGLDFDGDAQHIETNVAAATIFTEEREGSKMEGVSPVYQKKHVKFYVFLIESLSQEIRQISLLIQISLPLEIYFRNAG
jgi:hypothetical protein